MIRDMELAGLSRGTQESLDLDGEEPLTLAQVGARLGVSRERVRQLKEQALARLRHPAHQQDLRALAEEA